MKFSLFLSAVAFKELCPAGPGYQYSASAQKFNQRVVEQLGNHGAFLVNHGNDNNQGASNYFKKDMKLIFTKMLLPTTLNNIRCS